MRFLVDESTGSKGNSLVHCKGRKEKTIKMINNFKEGGVKFFKLASFFNDKHLPLIRSSKPAMVFSSDNFNIVAGLRLKAKLTFVSGENNYCYMTGLFKGLLTTLLN